MNQAAVIKLIPELFWKSIRYEFEIVAFFFMELRFCEKIKIDPSFVLWIGTTMPFLKASSFLTRDSYNTEKSRARARILKSILPYFDTHKIILVGELRCVTPLNAINNTVQL